MRRLEELLEQAIPQAPDEFERMVHRKRRRTVLKRAGAAILGLSVASAGTVLVFQAFRPQPGPVDRPLSYQIGSVTRFRLDHPPQPIAAGLGAGWTLARQTKSEEIHTLYRLDSLTGDVEEIDLGPENPEDIAVGEGSVWVAGCREVSPDTSQCAEGKASLLRLDPRNGAVLGRTPLPGCCHTLFTGGDAVWIDALILPNRRVMMRVDPATSELSVRECCNGEAGYVDGYGAGWLWGASLSSGALLQIDPATLQIHRTLQDVCMISPWQEVVLAARCYRDKKVFGGFDPVTGRFIPSALRSTDYPYDRYAEELVATGQAAWFLERREKLIVRGFTSDGAIAGPWEVPLGPARASDFSIGPDPFSVAADAEAQALWVSDFQSGEVLRVAIEPALEESSTPSELEGAEGG